MLVRDWMTRRPVTVAPSTSIMEARRLLARDGIRHLPVVERGELVGLLSSRDLQVTDDTLLRALASLQSDLLTGRYRPVAEVMTRTPLVVAPGASVAAAASAMVTMRIGALPVVEGLRLVGILSLVDCVRALLSREPGPATARAGGPAEPDLVAPGAGDDLGGVAVVAASSDQVVQAARRPGGARQVPA